jgi:hypothetical protein
MTGVIATIPKYQFSSNGIPLVGGTLTTSISGTSTPSTTWQDLSQTTANTNPITLDSRGECILFLDSAVTYRFVLKNAAGVVQWTQDSINSSNAAAVLTALAASSGSSLVGFVQSGTGAVATTVQSKLRESVSVKDFGAVGDGVTDDTAAIQAAITSLGANGGEVFVPKGNYVITSRLNIAGIKTLKIRGLSNGINDPRAQPSTFFVRGLADYLFSYTGIDNELYLQGLSIDGANNTTTKSTVFKGLVTTSLVASNSAFMHFEDVTVGGSDSATPCLDLSRNVTGYFENCTFGYWGAHIQVKIGGAGYLATTNRFRNCHFHYARQNVEVGTNVTDVYFDSCIFESSIIAAAITSTNATFTSCYFENIGYDPSGNSRTTGITARNILGISYAPAISTSVTSAIFAQYAKITMIGCHYAYLASAPSILTTWFDGIGRGSGLGQDGVITVINPSFNNVNQFFHADAESPSARQKFVYNLYTSTYENTNFLSYNDARLLTSGEYLLPVATGELWYAKSDNGVITIRRNTGIQYGISASQYPGNGQWLVGDILEVAFNPGFASEFQCITAGTSAGWVTKNIFTKKQNNAIAGSGGTATFTLTSPITQGDLVELTITGTSSNTSIDYVAIVRLTTTNSTQCVMSTQVVSSTGATSATSISVSTTGVATTITITNNNAGVVSYYTGVTKRT